MARSICFYFEVHQPFRLSDKKDLYLSGGMDELFRGPKAAENEAVFHKVATKCYLPMTELLLTLLTEHPEYRVSFALSGVFLEQCELYGEVGQRVLQNFQSLVQTGRVELLSETYYHSLSFLYSKLEFAHQVQMHREKIDSLFHVQPTVFRNTELIYSDHVAEFVRRLGYHAILAEGWDSVIPDENPNIVRTAHGVSLSTEEEKIAHTYAPKKWLGLVPNVQKNIQVLTKNYKLSDDIAFRFGNKGWDEYPLTVEKFLDWVEGAPGDTINLFMDFETFGEHQWEATGIFEFMRQLPISCIQREIQFRTPSETVRDFPSQGVFTCAEFLSWADEHRDISAWIGNDMQRTAFDELVALEQELYLHRDHPDGEVQQIWHDFRKLQTSDHLYYMCTKYWSDGDVHAYFSPYQTPHDAFTSFMFGVDALRERMKKSPVLAGKQAS